jgi:PKD repeat protein
MKKLFLSISIFCVVLLAQTQNTLGQSCCNANFSSQGLQLLTWKFSPEDSTDTNLYSWKWEFGDGTISNNQSPLHSYKSGGDYVVKLTKTKKLVINNEVVTASCAISKHVIIKPVYPPVTCIAQFSVQQTANTVSLKNESTILSKSKTYLWNFGDGNIGVIANPIHAYLKPGTYTIKLTVKAIGYDNKVETCTYTTQVIIQGKQTCKADFSYQISNGVYYFAPKDSLSNYYSYWTFGDGNFIYDKFPAHQYSNSGTYTVCQYKSKDTFNIVSNGCKVCKDINVVVDTIIIQPQDSCFSFFSTQIVNNTVYFTSGTPLKLNEYNYYDFGDGSFDNSVNPSHTYSNSGTYNVIRTVVRQGVNGGNQYDSCKYAQTVIIANQNTDSCFAGFTYSFNGDSIILVANVSSGLHSWNLGDGNYRSGGNRVSYIYNTNGTYNVCHFRMNPGVDSCNECKTIQVYKPTVSPNPADGFITISSPQDSLVSYILMDNMGVTVASQNNIYLTQTSIPVQSFPSGYYTLKVVFGNNRYAFYTMLVQH